MKKPPCVRDCPNRYPGCHDKCAVYRAWKKELDAAHERKRCESMLDGHSEWIGYDKLYWDKPVNEERRKGWNARKQEEAKRRKAHDEHRETGSKGWRTAPKAGDGARGSGKRSGA